MGFGTIQLMYTALIIIIYIRSLFTKDSSCNWTYATMKSTKVQTLGVVTLRATTAYTDDTSSVGLSLLNWAYSVVSCLVLHVVWSVHVRVFTCYSLVHACAYAGPSCTDVKQRVYETLQREQNGGLELARSR